MSAGTATAAPGTDHRALTRGRIVWAASMILLLSGWKPGNYLSLELAWALPPIALQLAVGADILWHYRRLVIVVLVSATLYLYGTDALAIHGELEVAGFF